MNQNIIVLKERLITTIHVDTILL